MMMSGRRGGGASLRGSKPVRVVLVSRVNLSLSLTLSSTLNDTLYNNNASTTHSGCRRRVAAAA